MFVYFERKQFYAIRFLYVKKNFGADKIPMYCF